MLVLQTLEAYDADGALPPSTGQITEAGEAERIIADNLDGAEEDGLERQGEWMRDRVSGIAIRQGYVEAAPFYETPVRPFGGSAAPPPAPKPIDAIGDGTLKVFAWGQSHSGNHGRARYGATSALAWAFTGGASYPLCDPMPGPDGVDGSIWPRFADLAMGKPIRGTAVNGVIIDCCARGGTSIRDWIGPLSALLSSELRGFLDHVGEPSFLHYCQGAADTLGMSTEQWLEAFKAMLEIVRGTGCTAPVYVDIATMCNMREATNPPPNEALYRSARVLIDYEIGRRNIRAAQAQAANLNENTRPGANFDAIDWRLRAYGDGCHMGELGLQAHAQALVAAVWCSRD